jgi:hypothetical protein
LTTYVDLALVDSSAIDNTVGKRRSIGITPAGTSEEHVWFDVNSISHGVTTFLPEI